MIKEKVVTVIKGRLNLFQHDQLSYNFIHVGGRGTPLPPNKQITVLNALNHRRRAGKTETKGCKLLISI